MTTDGERPAPAREPGPPDAPPRREPAPVGWPGASPGRDGGYDDRAATRTQPVTPAVPLGGPGAAPAGPAPARPPSSPVGAPVAPPRPAPGSATGAGPGQRPVTVGAQPARRSGRRARLTVKRIDPWSTLKFSFVYSLAGLVVLLVAVVALYGIVDAMGVLNSIRSFLHDVEGSKNSSGIAAWLSFGRVLTVAGVVGVINVILFTAFATVTAFIYNVCTDLVGGVEVTLAEKG